MGQDWIVRQRIVRQSLKWAGFGLGCLLLAGVGAVGQTAPVTPPPRISRPGSGPARRAPKTDTTPCVEKAGIEKSVMDKAIGIRGTTRTQVAGVCADESLTHPQRADKAAELRKAAHAQIDALIPKSQQDALHACQASHSHRPRRHRGPHRTPDACGYVEPSATPVPNADDSDDAAPATDKPVAPDATTPDKAVPSQAAPDTAVPNKDAAPAKDASPQKTDDPAKAPGKVQRRAGVVK